MRTSNKRMTPHNRIGIDGRAFYGVAAGTGRYVTALCQVLDQALPDTHFYVYANRPVRLPVSNERWHWRAEPSPLWRMCPASVWFFLRCGSLASRDDLNVFWGCANFLPLGLPARIKTVLTVYDLVFRLFPQTMGWKYRLVYRLFFGKSLARADRIVTISEGTARRLQHHFGVTSDAVVRPAVRAGLGRPTPEAIARTRARHQLPEGYLLSVSTLEPRKNLPTLLQALIHLTESGAFPGLCLVLVGQRGWLHHDLERMLQRSRQAGLQVMELGYVPDEDLPALYADARAVLMPSLYEGFGMPVLEALQCGARVMTSDTPETREAGGQHALYVTPDVPGIQAGLQALLRSPQPCHTPAPAVAWSWQTEGQTLAQLIRTAG